MRIIYGAVFFPLYLTWVLCHLLIRRDLKQRKNDFYALTFFVSVWAVIYYWLFFLEH